MSVLGLLGPGLIAPFLQLLLDSQGRMASADPKGLFNQSNLPVGDLWTLTYWQGPALPNSDSLLTSSMSSSGLEKRHTLGISLAVLVSVLLL